MEEPKGSLTEHCAEDRSSCVIPRPISSSECPDPWIHWKRKLGSPRCVVAPMVDQSELAWRMLSRANGAQLCWTPMFHAQLFASDPTYRRENFVTCSEDRPLIVQFCANDAKAFVTSCQMVGDACDGVDLNLGCPQSIARKGRYGAFLQDDWDLIYNLVRNACQHSQVPVSCKIRVFKDVDKTVRYAKMLESAGCQFVTVHGRTREMKGKMTGLADWSQIAAVKKALNIPVIANGNIQYFSDIDKCIQETGADAVMSAEGNLMNPFLFKDLHEPTWVAARAYLDFVDRFPCSMSLTRAHLFKLFNQSFVIFDDLRDQLSRAGSTADCRSIVTELEFRCSAEHEKYLKDAELLKNAQLPFPHWICQPYVRPPEREAFSMDGRPTKESEFRKRKREHLEEVCGKTGMSKRFVRKLERRRVDIGRRLAAVSHPPYDKCQCGNPLSKKCDFQLCRNCCRDRSAQQRLDCVAHHFQFTVKQPRWVLADSTAS